MERILTAGNASRRFGSGSTKVVAMRDVSLAVAPGEIVLIMGPSGSSKTTLLSMLDGLLQPSAGRIQIGQDDLTRLDERRLPEVRLRRTGFIFQDFNLLSSLSCLDNVALVVQLTGVSRRVACQRARQLPEELGMGHRLGFRPEKLSGGEKQRIAMARALVNKPDLILPNGGRTNKPCFPGRKYGQDVQQARQKKQFEGSHPPNGWEVRASSCAVHYGGQMI